MRTTPARRAHRAAYYQDHREELLAYQAAYDADHSEAGAAYRAAHREEKSAYDAAHYAAIREKNAKDFAEFTAWLQILRAVNGCADCGTHDGRLVHHHVDPSTKKLAMSDMYSHSLDALEEELEKCVVLCRSCHKYRHDALRAATS